MQFYRKWIVLSLLTVFVLALSGCIVTTPTPGAPATEAPTGTPTEDTATVEPPAGTATPAMPAAITRARDTFAQQMDMAGDAFTVVSYEEAEWPDGCLGLAKPDEMCTMAIVPGYLIILEAEGTRYALRTSLTGDTVRVAPLIEVAPSAGATVEPAAQGEAALVWQQETAEGCRAAQVTLTGVQYGACDGGLAAGALNEDMARTAQLHDMLASYASFTADTPAGKVTFTGQGMLTATPAEQRMLAEWAGQVAREAETGAANAMDGLAFIWHREGGIAGFCDDLSVYMTGIAYGSDCSGTLIQSLGSRRLTGDELAELYTWVDGLASFQERQKDPATADAMTVGLLLTGRGERVATDEEKAAMTQFASEVLLRWADPTPVPSVLAQADLTIYAGPAESYPPMGEVFAGQSARVTGVKPDSTWWRVVCPDDTLGNCWVTGDSKLAQPNVPAGATGLDPIDETGIYAAVARQVYTVDHTFGDNPPNFPRIYLLRADDIRAGGSDAPEPGMPVIATPVQQSIVAVLSDLPALFTWITKLEDAPRDENGTIQDNGAVITLGNIQPQPDGTIQVAASIYIGMLAAGGQTYVLEQVGGAWQITGTTGMQWIS
jgi:hypothetical protein